MTSRSEWGERKRGSHSPGPTGTQPLVGVPAPPLSNLREPQPSFPKNGCDDNRDRMELMVKVSGILERVVTQSSLNITLCKRTIKQVNI